MKILLIFYESNIFVESLMHIVNFKIGIRILNMQLNSNFWDFRIWYFCQIPVIGLILTSEILMEAWLDDDYHQKNTNLIYFTI